MKPRKRSPNLKRFIVALVIIIILIVAIFASTLRGPVVNVVGVQVKYSGTPPWRTYTTYATVEVQNPNLIGVTVLNIKGTFNVNGQYGGDFERTESVDIPSQSTTTFEVQVTLKSTVTVYWNADNEVEVMGTVTVHGATDWTVPFDETRTVHVP